MTSQPRLFFPWAVLAAVCTASMWLSPGGETIPYHVAWIGLALAFGFDPWPPRLTFVAIMTYMVASGAILVARAAAGTIAWEECSEIPLMAILVLLSVWHVRRREFAWAEVRKMANRDRMHAQQRERLSRLTTHEMRTPLTIALGYLGLVLDADPDEGVKSDLLVVRDELGRLSRASERLLRMIRLQDEPRPELIRLDGFFRQVADRWAAVAERRWLVEAGARECLLSTERLRVCLDTLIENALRHTSTGDVIRLTSFRHGTTICLGVGDAGPGFDDELAVAINNQDFRTAQQLSQSSASGQTGLGLALLHEMVAVRQGKVLAGRSAEGGALVLMSLPGTDAGLTRVRGEEPPSRRRPAGPPRGRDGVLSR
jgi:two-component system, OmpR family, sensor kinase